VFDVISFIDKLLKNDSKLVSAIDTDASSTFTFKNNRERAFYIYRQYISDHMPIILDILVDEIDPQYKKWIEEKKNYLLQLQPATGTERYFGQWTAIAEEPPKEARVSRNNQGSFDVTGVVAMVCFPGVISVAAGDRLMFLGPSPVNQPSSSLLGKMARGTFELGDRVSIRLSDNQGKWITIERCVSQEKGFALNGGPDKKEKLRGRLMWMDAKGNIAVVLAIGGKSNSEIYQGPGTFSAAVAVGEWVEGIFQHS